MRSLSASIGAVPAAGPLGAPDGATADDAPERFARHGQLGLACERENSVRLRSDLLPVRRQLVQVSEPKVPGAADRSAIARSLEHASDRDAAHDLLSSPHLVTIAHLAHGHEAGGSVLRIRPSDHEAVHFGQTEKPKKIQWRGNFVEDVLHATLHISPIAMVTIPAAKNLELSRPGAQHF